MKVLRLHEDAVLPTRKHPTDAGLDLYALGSGRIESNSSEIVGTGIAVELPEYTFGLIMPKSRNNYLIGAGVVDQNYRGELLVKVVNTNSFPVYISKGNAIAQLIVIPIYYPTVEEVIHLEFNKETDRGATGGIVSQLKSATFTSKVED